MKIVITGADSFIAKNLIAELSNRGFLDFIAINDVNETKEFENYIRDSDFIFHLQTIYRSNDEESFACINANTTKKIIELIGCQQKSLLLLSSTQAGNGSYYGQSKLIAEEYVNEWMQTTENKAYIFRLANEFGKWCPPNLNSVVATFCHNIANGYVINVNNPDAVLKLQYIDDIIDLFILALEGELDSVNPQIVPTYNTTVGEVARTLELFHVKRRGTHIPEMDDGLIKKLYSTYLSYLPSHELSIPLEMHTDMRGSFTELLHFGDMGQVSVNISKPGITKGNHWHHSKNEKFIVIVGEGIIKLRKIGTEDIIEYRVSGNKIEAIDIPPGFTHNITNTGEVDMFTIMWANEIFDKYKPDTYFEEV